MSEQEQQQAPKVDEVAKETTEVQPEKVAATEATADADKVAESTETVAQQDGDEPAKPEESTEEGSAEKSGDDEQDKAKPEDKVEDNKALEGEKVDEEKAENGKAEEDKSVEAEANGDGAGQKTESNEVAGDETNGVHKRKAENGAEPVAGDEKSPKKAKVVDEADQAKVEETAA